MSDEGITRIDLGDAGGDDDHLRGFLPEMEERVNDDAPETATVRKLDLWGLIRGGLADAAGYTWQGLKWVKERFDNHVINQARAKKIEAEAAKVRAEATGTRKKDTAEAEKIAAEADEKRADAAVKLAQAEAIRTETQMKLIEKLEARGIDWQAELDDDGHLNIVVTKARRLE